VPKGAFLSLKKKNKEWNVSNILKSKKKLLSYLTHHSKVQYSRGRNPSLGNVPKEKKKGKVSNVFKSKKNKRKFLFPSFNLLNSNSSLKFKSKTSLKKKKKRNASNVPKLKNNKRKFFFPLFNLILVPV
jgi:hypothetical protein